MYLYMGNVLSSYRNRETMNIHIECNEQSRMNVCISNGLQDEIKMEQNCNSTIGKDCI